MGKDWLRRAAGIGQGTDCNIQHLVRFYFSSCKCLPRPPTHSYLASPTARILRRRWWRVMKSCGQTSTGTIIVRYRSFIVSLPQRTFCTRQACMADASSRASKPSSCSQEGKREKKYGLRSVLRACERPQVHEVLCFWRTDGKGGWERASCSHPHLVIPERCMRAGG